MLTHRLFREGKLTEQFQRHPQTHSKCSFRCNGTIRTLNNSEEYKIGGRQRKLDTICAVNTVNVVQLTKSDMRYILICGRAYHADRQALVLLYTTPLPVRTHFRRTSSITALHLIQFSQNCVISKIPHPTPGILGSIKVDHSRTHTHATAVPCMPVTAAAKILCGGMQRSILDECTPFIG